MLSITNLHAGYGKVEVLHGISLEVPKGQVVTLIGSNGAGKTTTMRAISGMIAPREGKVMLGDVDITGRESHRIARLGLAHSPEGRRVFATMTVNDNLLLGAFPRFTGARRKGDIDADLERAMEYFPRLKERRLQLAGTLSGGEQQMLAMARALMARPKLICMDEPTMGLSPLYVDKVLELIDAINRQGVTVFMVEQNASLALEIAHYGYVLQTGRVVLEGPAKTLLDDERVRDAYLGGEAVAV